MLVSETFFSVDVRAMGRAARFYVDALGAAVAFESPGWSSLRIAGVRVALFLSPEHQAGAIGLHFVVHDVLATEAAVERAGGRVLASSVEVAQGVVISTVADTEGNAFTLRQS
jgi:predicted enzyme related to lactoylglutathione lyase